MSDILKGLVFKEMCHRKLITAIYENIVLSFFRLAVAGRQMGHSPFDTKQGQACAKVSVISSFGHVLPLAKAAWSHDPLSFQPLFLSSLSRHSTSVGCQSILLFHHALFSVECFYTVDCRCPVKPCLYSGLGCLYMSWILVPHLSEESLE